MKKQVLAFLAGIVVTALVGFKVLDYDIKKGTAEVDHYQGVYLFMDCTPVMEYDYVGTVKVALTWTGSYEEIKRKLIKKAKKKYANFDGIMMEPSYSGTSTADIIRFKE